MEALLGSDYCFVHFNQQPGLAKIEIAHTYTPGGEPLLDENALSTYSLAFAASGFTGGIA